jgi:iron-sulfur cluster assembly protein
MVDMVQDKNVIEETPVMTVTALAAEKIHGLLEEKGIAETHGLRVFVAGGGCSGLQYGMAFESNPMDNDRIVEMEGVKLIIDPVSLPYIQGASIDFVDSLMGGGFRIENPNAVSSCGCGSSFRTGEDAGGQTHAHGGGCSCG